MSGRWTTIVVVICWGLVTLVWLTGAAFNRRRAPRVLARSRPKILRLLGPLAATAWIVTELAHRQIGLPAEEWLSTIALCALPLCAAFTTWARFSLGTMWTPAPCVRRDHVLRTSGPYAMIRHPIYTGVLGMALCTAATTRQAWLLAVFLVAVVTLNIKIRSEERIMRQAFPADYDRYRRRVPRLVPSPFLHVKSRQRSRTASPEAIR
ncbi:Isoprenylcysteine carboxyl methyltransferase [Parafrankia sp. EAN1pec]|uniref:methyltransferase family protein n=1 Tax=Parafrankia sp. (strain EAN1pec) TaxID=298653 RepID=UPI0000541509|nr:Isoprenylcysteine carboxyl methyltransferase [Frankia sp. EAN1pec]